MRFVTPFTSVRWTLGFALVLNSFGLMPLMGSATANPAVKAQVLPELRITPLMLQGGGPRVVADLELTLVWIQPGRFNMGRENSDRDESPVTTVTLTRGFWLGQTEVTQAQWKAIMGTNPSNFKGDTNPVEQVTWREADEFCRKLTAREQAAGRLTAGLVYMLPTEAQWEYACRAGAKGDYAGNLEAMAWYANNSGNTPHPVAKKQPNAWGLYDMHGNVWEWCADWYESYAGGSVTDPAGPAKGTARVNRGGGWRLGAPQCRSSYRIANEPEYRGYNLGFRLALCAVR